MDDIQGEVAFILEVDKDGKMKVVEYKMPSNGNETFEQDELIATYLAATLDTGIYTDQELYTLDTYLTQKIGKTESVKTAAMYEMVEKQQKAREAKKRARANSYAH